LAHQSLKQAKKHRYLLKKASKAMKQYILLLATVFFFCCCCLQGVGAEEALTWEQCVQEAKKNHPDLISAEAVVKQAQANQAIAISNILPQVSTELRQSTSKTGTERSDAYSYGVTAQQLLFDGLKTPYDIAAAARNVKSARYNYEVTSADIRLRLRTAFIELLKAQEFVTIAENIAQRRKQNADLVQLLYDGGREHRGSLLTAQANLAEAKFEVTQAQRAITVAQRQLSKELGRKEVKPIQVTGNFEVINVKRERPNFEALATSTPSLESLVAKTEAAKLSLKSAKAEFFPQVYANAQASRSDSYWPPDNDQWSVGVTLSYPLFEGGRRWAEVSKARAVLNQTEADERSNKDSIILTLEDTWTTWQNAIDNVVVQKKFLQATEERAKIAQAQYSNGLISFDNWTIIEDDLVRTQKSFLDAQANAFLSEAQWIQSQGGILDYVE
jgi:outer membrane protein TolC